MARISRQVREIINIAIFIIVIGLLVTFYMIYPLNKTADFMGRAGQVEFNPDSLPANDPTAFLEAGFATADTFRVEADGLTNLAVVYLAPEVDSATDIRGTVVLLHNEGADRVSMIPLAGRLVDSGFAVVVYDQRAAGLSSGNYHGDGQYEASDLVELIGYLQLRNRIHRPLATVGLSVGAEAVLLALNQDDRIDRAVAVKPYLSSRRMLDLQKREHEALWFPFYRTIVWWWYGIRSGYAAPYRTIDDIRAVGSQTLVLIDEQVLSDPEVVKLQELSDPNKLELKPLPKEEAALLDEIVSFVTR
jgi:pimeloyl-ACP methyl ester carboxylesterase